MLFRSNVKVSGSEATCGTGRGGVVMGWGCGGEAGGGVETWRKEVMAGAEAGVYACWMRQVAVKVNACGAAVTPVTKMGDVAVGVRALRFTDRHLVKQQRRPCNGIYLRDLF